MQLTHPAFLILDSGKGSKSLAKIAETSRDGGGELLLEGFERDFFPIYPASAKMQSWDIYACVRQVLDVLDPVADPLPESVLQSENLMSEDEALRAIHLSENEAERDRARERLAFDEAVGSAMGAGVAPTRRTRRIGPARSRQGRRAARGA